MTLLQTLITILAIIGVGVFCQRRKVFNHAQTEGFEQFLFKIGIPCYLFNATLNYTFTELVDTRYICSYLLSFLVVAFVVSCYFYRRLTAAQICIKILASGYVNAAIYALPVITFLFNDPKAAILSNLIQVIIIQSLFIILISLVVHSEKSFTVRILSSISSPIIVMPFLGLLLNFFGFELNITIIKVIQNLGHCAMSIALFTFGLSLGSLSLSERIFKKDIMFIVLTKNVVHPLAAMLIGGYIFCLDKYWLNSLVITTSAPTAFVVYLISKQFEIEQDKVKAVLAISSAISLITLFLITWSI